MWFKDRHVLQTKEFRYKLTTNLCFQPEICEAADHEFPLFCYWFIPPSAWQSKTTMYQCIEMVSTFTFSIFTWLCSCFLPKILDFNFDASVYLSTICLFVHHLSKDLQFLELVSKVCELCEILDYCYYNGMRLHM